MKSVILCAGRGERLMPLTNQIPKPLIEIEGRPILFYILNSLPDKIDEIYLVIQEEKKELFENFIKNINLKIKVVFLFQNKEKRGSYFALLAAKNFLEKEEKFLVLNGDDIFLKSDLEKLLDSNSPVYGLGYKKMDSRYKTCDLDRKNRKIVSFRKQTEKELKKKVFCFSGAFTLTPNFFSYEPVYVNGEAGIPHTLFASKKDVFYILLSDWIQINTVPDLLKAKTYFKI